MESMDNKKNIGMIVTAVTAFFCGCPSVCAMAFGLMFVVGDDAPQLSGGAGIDGGMEVGLVMLCIGFFVALIPVFAGIYTFSIWQKAKKGDEYATRGETDSVDSKDDEVIIEVEGKDFAEDEVVKTDEPDPEIDEDEIPPAI